MLNNIKLNFCIRIRLFRQHLFIIHEYLEQFNHLFRYLQIQSADITTS